MPLEKVPQKDENRHGGIPIILATQAKAGGLQAAGHPGQRCLGAKCLPAYLQGHGFNPSIALQNRGRWEVGPLEAGEGGALCM